MTYKYILFDLDGTITDSREGITKGVKYSLDKMGISNVKLEELNKFIGPPLKESYIKYYNFSEKESEKAINYFREYYKEIGIYENELYEGIEKLISELVEMDKILIIATSKVTEYAEIIIEYFGLSKYFTYIVGSNMDGTRTNKHEVIEYALQISGIEDKKDIIMIGDRKHDIIGAKQNKIDCIGVEYGYGSKEELSKVNADYIVKDINELAKLLTAS